MNVLTIILASSLIAQVPTDRSWSTNLRDDARSKVGNERIVRTKSPAKEGEVISYEVYVSRMTTSHFEANIAVRDARTLGNLMGTEQMLLERLSVYPSSQSLRIDLFNAYAESRQWRKAYAAVAPELSGSSAPNMLLRASLASAMIGKVYVGQREYLLTEVMGSNELIWPDYENALPRSSSPWDIAILSLIAIGREEFLHGSLGEYNAELYLRYAAGMDWGNPIVGHLLGSIFVRNGRNLEAEIYLAPAVVRSTGILKEENERLLRRARGG